MKALKVVGLGAALALTSQASVAALITDWNWSLDSAFTSFTGTSVVASGDVNADPDGDTVNQVIGQSKMTWGTDAGFGLSSLEIANPNLSTDDTATPFELTETAPGSGIYSDTVDGTLGIHNNFPIRGGALTSFVMTEYFRLVPAPGAPAGPAIETTFSSDFKETPNQPALPCCDDIFVIADGAALGELVTFTMDDWKYTVSLSADGLGPLTADQCAELGYAAGCFGLVTTENATNNFQFRITLTATKVSEPSLLALMGLGLLGMAYRRRRAA